MALIAALGKAAEISLRGHAKRREACRRIRDEAVTLLSPLNPQLTGDQSQVMDHVLNVSFFELDSEALMVALKDLIAISNGSACTSTSYPPSRVLTAMGMSDDEVNGCVRISWCHFTPQVDWETVASRIRHLL